MSALACEITSCALRACATFRSSTMRRVLRIAEDEFHADLIHFDNTSMQAEPSIFQHPLAIEQFRDFLHRSSFETSLHPSHHCRYRYSP